ncbi:MAG: tetratricopeptide repeat protein [Candidatus Omnitrophica bacterium]|nr:tetratricopeptide repeat protein [Candidatus Omnitrophota bacterium]
MSAHGKFGGLRHELDQAITYGTRKDALVLARRGLRQAEQEDIRSEAEYFKGQIDLLKDNLVSAIEHFDATIRLDPADGAAYNDRALCMVDLGIIDDALVYFDKGIKAEPDYATIYHNKGWLLNNIGRHTEAVACFRKALELEPGRAVTYDNLADALANLGDCRGALDAYRRVLEFLKPGQCPSIRKAITRQIRDLEQKMKRQ